MSGWSTEAMDTAIMAGSQEDPVPGSETEADLPPESWKFHVLDTLERDFERQEAASAAPVSEPVKTIDVGGERYPDLSNLTTKKIPHKNLIMDHICTHCAHCGHELSDSISVLRGIGPRCSSRGYAEDPTEADEIQAMIDLAEFPELVDFLMEHYRPLGIRGLVNGLVRVASLNRPRGRGWAEGNAKVHAACCDSIQSLGHKLMADLLRETLVIMEVKDADGVPGAVSVWVKRRDWTKYWSFGLKRIPGTYFSRQHKANIVPVHDPSDPKRPKLTGRSRTAADGRTVPETNKAALWALMLEHYEGCVAKINGKVVKIGK